MAAKKGAKVEAWLNAEEHARMREHMRAARLSSVAA